MKPSLICALVFFSGAFCFAAPNQSTLRFTELPLGKEAKFHVRSVDCYSGYTRTVVDGIIRRNKGGWKIGIFETSRKGIRRKSCSVVVERDVVKLFDESLVDKVYGPDDIVLSGAILIDVAWPGGNRTEAGGGGNESRIFHAIAAARNHGMMPKQPPQRTSCARR